MGQMQIASKAWLLEILTMEVAHLSTSVSNKTVKTIVSLHSMVIMIPRMEATAGGRDLGKLIGIS